MIDYTTNMIARSEHEYLQRSLAPVLDYHLRHPGWVSRKLGQLLHSLRSNVALQEERISPSENAVLDVSRLRGQEGTSTSG
jgi:hypothetical protein